MDNLCLSGRQGRKSLSLLAKSAELAIAAPQVIAHRVTRMAIAGPTLSARDRKEFQLMVAEKMAGFGEAWSAMVLQTIRANQTVAVCCFGHFGAFARPPRVINCGLPHSFKALHWIFSLRAWRRFIARL
jgi:hypothetical protein